MRHHPRQTGWTVERLRGHLGPVRLHGAALRRGARPGDRHPRPRGLFGRGRALPHRAGRGRAGALRGGGHPGSDPAALAGVGVPGHPHPAGGQQGGPAGLRHRRRGAPAAGGVLPPAAGHPAGGTPRHRPVPDFGEPRLLGGRPGRGRGIRRRPGRSLFGGPAGGPGEAAGFPAERGGGPAGVPPAVRLGQTGPGHPGAAAGHHPVAALCPRPEEEPLSAVVFQVDHDPAMGKAAHLGCSPAP